MISDRERVCAHPEPSQSAIVNAYGTAAFWCGICGAVKPAEGDLAGAWVLPRARRMGALVARLRRLLETIDKALLEDGA